MTFKEFYNDQGNEDFVNKLAQKMAQQLKVSATPIVKIQVNPGQVPINAYRVPVSEVGKRLGIMEKRYIPWLYQHGLLVNDPDTNDANKGFWVINADQLKSRLSHVANLVNKIANNNVFQASNYLFGNMWNQFGRTNPQTKGL